MNNLISQIKKKGSFLCVGLDTDVTKIPNAFKRYKNPVLEFNKAIIDATHDLCVSYKINTAFYESNGSEGWDTMHKTVLQIPSEVFTIADAKRGDIGNTASQYAKAFFETLNFDAITLSPYMGKDTLEPFLAYEDKTIIVLALTSNKGSQDFETLETKAGDKVYERIIKEITSCSPAERTQFVVGATHPKALKGIRTLAPNNFFLVPGVGAQGGSLEDVYKNGANNNVGLLVNVSRGIIYAGNDAKDPIIEIRKAAEAYQKQMQALIGND